MVTNNTAQKKGIRLTQEDYTKLGQKFDSCYELETQVLGNPFYSSYSSKYFVPCNEKIIILVSDLFGDASVSQSGGTVGYFYQGDVINQTYLDKASPDAHSNKCEMFYIDALFLTQQPKTVYSTLVHEFNHMINYIIKTVNYASSHESQGLRTCDTWFTEMLSMTTEDMFQQYLGIEDKYSPKARLPYFNMLYKFLTKHRPMKFMSQFILLKNRTVSFLIQLFLSVKSNKLYKEVKELYSKYLY